MGVCLLIGLIIHLRLTQCLHMTCIVQVFLIPSACAKWTCFVLSLTSIEYRPITFAEICQENISPADLSPTAVGQ